MKKILVTGGLGFVGSNLVDKLIEDGHDVMVIDNISSISSSSTYINVKAKYVYGDIENIRELIGVRKFDTIFHLAAEARIQPSFDAPAHWFWANAMGTVEVLDYARRNGCGSFVYATTSSKNHGSHLITPYTFSKVVGEDACRMYADIYGMNIGMATFYNVYGPREPREGEFATVVAKFSRQHEKGEAITIVGNGEQSRDFTHVSDIVDGLIKISEGNWKGDNFDLGRGESVKIIDLAMMITGGVASNITFVPLRKGEGMHTLCNVEETYNKLGWKAVKRLSDYIQTLTYTNDL